MAGLVTSSSSVPLKTHRVGQRCTLNLSRAETSSRWCGVVDRRGGCKLRFRPRHLTMVQIYIPSSHKSLREVVGRGKEVGGPDTSQGVFPQNWGGTEQSHTVTCMVFNAKANDRRKGPSDAFRRDEFRGP
ncbi:uncharacterized protein TNCV_4102011 [Trichonephila clavipes]|nr:uncharacterized protein TNCV_4102011 [Trichonephila clavipes]